MSNITHVILDTRPSLISRATLKKAGSGLGRRLSWSAILEILYMHMDLPVLPFWSALQVPIVEPISEQIS